MVFLLLVSCVVPSPSKLADRKLSKGDVLEPATRSSDTKTEKPADKRVDGSRHSAVDRSDEDINYTYPDEVQLVPNIPVSPQSPKYSLVPVRRLSTTTPYSTDVNHYVDDFHPTIPPDFAQEIDKIRMSYNTLPGFNSGPQPLDEEDDDDAADEDADEEDYDNNNYLLNDYLARPQYKNTLRALPYQHIPGSNKIPQNGVKIVVKHRPEHTNPLIVTSYPPYEQSDGLGYKDETSQTLEDYPQRHPRLNHDHPYSPLCNDKVVLRHYGPAQPVPSFRQFNHAPLIVKPRLPMARAKKPRAYVRYPRNYRTYYHHPAPNNRVKVMTQSFVYHPSEYYRDLRNPVMMSSMPELRNAKSPQSKRKRKKKKSKSKGIKGECKPKKIIKEIHFHHYDPQLSAQLAPLEGINFKDGEDYENDIKVITKETEIDEDKKNPEDYDHQYNEDVQKEIDEQKQGNEQRTAHPSYYRDSYNPQYSETGSMEYIDYNVQTDSSSSTLMGNRRNFPQSTRPRSPRVRKSQESSRAAQNSTDPAQPPARGPMRIQLHGNFKPMKTENNSRQSATSV